MDPVILAAIIGAVGTIAGSVITWLLTRLLDGRPRLPILGQERRMALEGTWNGKIRQRQGPIREVIISDWAMKARKRRIEGAASLHINRDGKTITIFLKITGALIHGRYFRVEYRGAYQGREDFVQFGVGIMELSLDAHTLKGFFVGIGPITEGLIYGTAELKKPFE